MKKIRTLIVDDESLARDRLRQLLQAEPEIELVGESSDGRAAVAAIKDLAPDLVFLDVQMPELDGFQVLQAVGAETAPAIVFVTAYDQFALRAFEIHAVDYLLKPFDRSRFQKALQHAMNQIQHRADSNEPKRQTKAAGRLPASNSPEQLMVKSGSHVVWVRLSEISWIGSADNYAELHVGSRSHLMRETMAALESRLLADTFLRISRSVIVNLRHIREVHRLFYGGYELILNDNTRLTLSRRNRDKLRQLGIN